MQQSDSCIALFRPFLGDTFSWGFKWNHISTLMIICMDVGDLGFMSLSTLFTSYQEEGRVVMKGSCSVMTWLLQSRTLWMDYQDLFSLIVIWNECQAYFHGCFGDNLKGILRLVLWLSLWCPNLRLMECQELFSSIVTGNECQAYFHGYFGDNLKGMLRLVLWLGLRHPNLRLMECQELFSLTVIRNECQAYFHFGDNVKGILRLVLWLGLRCPSLRLMECQNLFMDHIHFRLTVIMSTYFQGHTYFKISTLWTI